MDNPTNNTQQRQQPDYREGRVARTIEHQTAKLPSDMFLWAAGASVVGSLALQLLSPKRKGFFRMLPTRQGQIASFVGQWAPTLLMLGVYNKIVKTVGSDQYDRHNAE